MLRSITFLIGLAIAQQSCTRPFVRYEGFVYSRERLVPLEGLQVRAQFSSGPDARTNAKGFFRIPAKPNLLETIYILKDGRTIDSIFPILEHAGESREYQFVDGRRDTLFVAEQ